MNKLSESDIKIMRSLIEIAMNKEKNSYELRLKASELGFAFVKERNIDPQKTRLVGLVKLGKIIASEKKENPRMRKWI